MLDTRFTELMVAASRSVSPKKGNMQEMHTAASGKPLTPYSPDALTMDHSFACSGGRSLGAMNPIESIVVEPALEWLDGAVGAENATTAADGGDAESDPSHKDLLVRLVLNLLDEESR